MESQKHIFGQKVNGVSIRIMVTSKNVCFIFARGGSQGLINKNIRPFAGKSLLEYTIKFACALEFVDKVYVSSENDDIKKNFKITICKFY